MMLFGVSRKTAMLESLWAAAYKGNLEDVISVVKSREVNVNAFADFDGRTALMQASRQGHTAVVRFLLSEEGGAGASLNHRTYVGETALSDAVNQGHLDTASFLLSKGAVGSEELLTTPGLSDEIRRALQDGILLSSGGLDESMTSVA